MLRAVWRLQVEAAWAAAPAQVVISGAAGPASVNGRYEQVEREVYTYAKVGEPGLWLFVAKDGRWHVGTTAGKDARKTKSWGQAHSVASAGGISPPAGAGQWQVCDGKGGWWVKQTVEVELLSAAQAREWAARQAEQVGAPTASHVLLPCLCHSAEFLRTEVRFTVLRDAPASMLTLRCACSGGRAWDLRRTRLRPSAWRRRLSRSVPPPQRHCPTLRFSCPFAAMVCGGGVFCC